MVLLSLTYSELGRPSLEVLTSFDKTSLARLTDSFVLRCRVSENEIYFLTVLFAYTFCWNFLQDRRSLIMS